MPSYVEIGSVVLENENVKSLQTDGQTDEQTDGRIDRRGTTGDQKSSLELKIRETLV